MTIIRLFLLCHWLPKSLADHRSGNECLEAIVGTPAALGELKVLIAKLFEYEN